MEDAIKALLLKHNCKFVGTASMGRVIWEDQNGNQRCDSMYALCSMSESAWDFWSKNSKKENIC